MPGRATVVLPEPTAVVPRPVKIQRHRATRAERQLLQQGAAPRQTSGRGDLAGGSRHQGGRCAGSAWQFSFVQTSNPHKVAEKQGRLSRGSAPGLGRQPDGRIPPELAELCRPLRKMSTPRKAKAW